MSFTRKQKTYGAVLLLGLAAVGIDRVFILPGRASADRPPSERYAVTRTAPPAPGPAAAAASPAQRSTIADLLDEIAAARGLDLTAVPDAFAPPAAWRGEEGTPPPALPDAAERFRRAHTLNAVMASGENGYVIIDGRTLFIGQELDGFVLISVGVRSAVLTSGRVRVVLTLPDAGGTSP